MPAKRKVVRRVSARRVKRPRGYNNASRDKPTVSKIHRRFVAYPITAPAAGGTSSDWLEKLKWFGSLAMKLLVAALAVEERDGKIFASSVTIGSSVIVALGPGDFTSQLPSGVKSSGYADDGCVVLPFERAHLRHFTVRIIPSVDMQSRGGVYAALIVEVSDVNVPADHADWCIKRFGVSLDDILKHPSARMAPVTRGLSLGATCRGTPQNLAVQWSEGDKKFFNWPATHALIIAYSDMAAGSSATADSQYKPEKSLFEVHVTGNVACYDPTTSFVAGAASNGWDSRSSQVLLTNSRKIVGSNTVYLTHFGESVSVPGSGTEVELSAAPLPFCRAVLKSFDRLDLLPLHPSYSDFVMADVE